MLLQNPDNQKQMKEYVKQGCKAFESFKDDCKEFVEDYFPMAVGIVLSYLQPELLCAQLGYCKAALQG